FLDKGNHLIADEQHQTGTVDHTPVYPREVVKRALELSAAVILVHNHPTQQSIVPVHHGQSPLNTKLSIFLDWGRFQLNKTGYEGHTAPCCRPPTDPSAAAGDILMGSLTDGAIRHALKRVGKSRKQESLTDGEGRGTGRLVLILKPMPTRVTAEWMVQQWRHGRRTK